MGIKGTVVEMPLKTIIMTLDNMPVEIIITRGNAHITQSQYNIFDKEENMLGFCVFKYNPNHIYVTYMENSSSKHKNVGTALHEILFLESVASKEGNIRLGAGYESLLFHFGLGFRVLPRMNFDWDVIGNGLKDPRLNQQAYLKWHKENFLLPINLENVRSNQVLEFYYHIYKTVPELRDEIKEALKLLKLTPLFLPDEAIQQKMKNYDCHIKTSLWEKTANTTPLEWSFFCNRINNRGYFLSAKALFESFDKLKETLAQYPELDKKLLSKPLQDLIEYEILTLEKLISMDEKKFEIYSNSNIANILLEDKITVDFLDTLTNEQINYLGHRAIAAKILSDQLTVEQALADFSEPSISLKK